MSLVVHGLVLVTLVEWEVVQTKPLPLLTVELELTPLETPENPKVYSDEDRRFEKETTVDKEKVKARQPSTARLAPNQRIEPQERVEPSPARTEPVERETPTSQTEAAAPAELAAARPEAARPVERPKPAELASRTQASEASAHPPEAAQPAPQPKPSPPAAATPRTEPPAAEPQLASARPQPAARPSAVSPPQRPTPPAASRAGEEASSPRADPRLDSPPSSPPEARPALPAIADLLARRARATRSRTAHHALAPMTVAQRRAVADPRAQVLRAVGAVTEGVAFAQALTASDAVSSITIADATRVDTRKNLLYAYLVMVRRRVESNWAPGRVLAHERRLWGEHDLKTHVFLRLDRGGRIEALRISRSSGDPAVDAHALQAVRQAEPFLPPPRDLLDREGGFGFSFGARARVALRPGS